MKRLVSALTLASILSLLLGVTAANATHSSGKGPKHDLVSGAGRLDVFAGGVDFDVHINAKSDPDGENPEGTFYARVGPSLFDVAGRVTCLNVVGDRATIGGEVTRSNLPGLAEGAGILIWVQDDDEGEGDEHAALTTAVPPLVCPGPIEPAVPNDRGNYIVHDAAP